MPNAELFCPPTIAELGSPLAGTSMKKLALLVLILSLFLALPGLFAQSVTTLLKGTQTQQSAPASADPLGRDTPSGTVLGFL